MLNQLDLLEVIDKDGKVVELETRTKVHQTGLLHREVYIWFFTSKGEIIFQHRAKNKDTFADKLDATVGGHVEPGMTVEETVVKECFEETGLKLEISNFTFLTSVHFKSLDKTTKLINNAMRYQYAYLYKEALSDLRVEVGAADSFEPWSIEQLEGLSTKDKERFIPTILSKSTLLMLKKAKNNLHL
ncbi:MAG: MutT (Nudix) family hydrolase [Parcubacteria group bacterium GW2011_GWC2_38_7]|nr:MAG: MutT (Nudix) family hydrolase [Parcubacteria group bacterium GW2011_GWC2_38_7]